MNNPTNKQTFEDWVVQNEMNEVTASHIREILPTTKVVLLCDDSSSMNSKLPEEGTDPFAPTLSTRWLQLKRLAAGIIDLVTVVKHEGIDLYFLNRSPYLNVESITGLQAVFSTPPKGDTPIISALHRIVEDNAHITGKLLIVVITDGAPTDGSRQELFNALTYITGSGNIHVSFAECTNQVEEMEYLDQWDGCIPNFDNTDDYREELQRVRNAQGAQFKFTFTDYIVKILLATFNRWYFSLDQSRVTDVRSNNGYSNQPFYPTTQQKPAYSPVQAYAQSQVQTYGISQPRAQYMIQPRQSIPSLPAVQPQQSNPVVSAAPVQQIKKKSSCEIL